MCGSDNLLKVIQSKNLCEKFVREVQISEDLAKLDSLLREFEKVLPKLEYRRLLKILSK